MVFEFVFDEQFEPIRRSVDVLDVSCIVFCIPGPRSLVDILKFIS